MSDSQRINQQLQEITDKLETGIKDLFVSEKYISYLKTISKFHNYSTRNTLLINLQMPGATMVGGYNMWKNQLERYVKRGEKSIRILAPTPIKVKKEMDKLDPDTQTPLIGKDGKVITEEVEVTIPKFKVVSVFDISQTDGKPLPQLAEDLTGDVRQYEAFMDALKQVSPLPISYENFPPEKDGVCRYGVGIFIREGMSEVQTVSAVIHEIAHAKLHDIDSIQQQSETVKPKDTVTKEVEAESVSYVVCQYYGIETSANSFGYLATWSSNRELTELKASIDIIRKTSANLINSIDEKFKEIIKERSMSLTVEATQKEQVEVAVEQTDNENPFSAFEKSEGEIKSIADIVKEKGVTPFIVDDGSEPLGNYPETTDDDRQEYLNHSTNCKKGNSNLSDETVKQDLPLNHQEVANATPTAPLSENNESNENDALLYDDILPDPSIGLSERDLYGYTYNGMLPLLQDRALELFDNDHTIYLLYEDNTEGMALERLDIENHNGIFGIETEEWVTAVEFQQMKAAVENSEATKETLLIFGKDDTFGIYQLKQGDETRNYRFESLNSLELHGLSVDRQNYRLVYTAPLSKKDTLDSIYAQFNLNHPTDFTGHSLSICDIVVFQRDNIITSHYVDTFGFKELPSFLGHEKPQTILQDTEHSQSTPSVAELEAQVKSGNSISLMDLSRAVKNEPKQTSSKGKPSILGQISEHKRQLAQGTDKTTHKRDENREV